MSLFHALLVCALVFTSGYCSRDGGQQGNGGNQGQQQGYGSQGGRGGSQGIIPSFLSNVTSDERQEYFNIVSNQSLTTDQINTLANEWAVSNGVQTQYSEYQTNVTAIHQQALLNVSEVISNLAVVQAKLEAIYTNTSSTGYEKNDAFEVVETAYPREVSVISSLQNTHEQEHYVRLDGGNNVAPNHYIQNSTLTST